MDGGGGGGGGGIRSATAAAAKEAIAAIAERARAREGTRRDREGAEVKKIGVEGARALAGLRHPGVRRVTDARSDMGMSHGHVHTWVGWMSLLISDSSNLFHT